MIARPRRPAPCWIAPTDSASRSRPVGAWPWSRPRAVDPAGGRWGMEAGVMVVRPRRCGPSR